MEERKSPSPTGVFNKLAEHKCKKQISVWRGTSYVQNVFIRLGNVFSISISNDYDWENSVLVKQKCRDT